jgi:hypothetical protein
MTELQSLRKVSRLKRILYCGELLAIALGRLGKCALNGSEHACQYQRADHFRMLHSLAPSASTNSDGPQLLNDRFERDGKRQRPS